MDFQTGRPDHINDWLAGYRTGGWYGYGGSEQIYANLIVHDGGSKPTESEVTAGLKAMQDDFDAKEYVRNRVGLTTGYLPLQEQLDQLYRDMQSGKLGVGATTGEWYVGITSVKTSYPKPS
tara:strand:+ start:205 stop:567 length:363 start_codon:yes stop_codon:yes gene_type:complete